MKNKKGFTLVELLAVVIILSIILSITAIAVMKVKKNQDRINYQNMISGILTGAKNYVTNHPGKTSVPVKELINKKYIDIDVEQTELVNATVNTATCTLNGVKRSFYISVPENSKYKAKTYNDCGCMSNTNVISTAHKLCNGNIGEAAAEVEFK